MSNRSLAVIAKDIRTNWAKPNYAAVPYLDAMAKLDRISDRYYLDDARSIVLYFLGSAGTFKGPEAKRIKAELKSMLASA